MSFLYPLFLIAGAALVIPVLIHLFNLRRYKTVFFPHTRFLQNIQLHSRKQSQVRYKLLLAMRLLFLILLILAFAQPFFSGNKSANNGNRLQVVYIDNSYSMDAHKGARTLLDLAKAAALQQAASAPGNRFILITNDPVTTDQPATLDKITADIRNIQPSPASKNAIQILAATQRLMQANNTEDADLYYYSDFQRTVLQTAPEKALTSHIHVYGIPVQAEKIQHAYIDTVFLTSPVLQTGSNNHLVVGTKLNGEPTKEQPVLQLTVNGQVKSTASPDFSAGNTRYDTLTFQATGTGWQQIETTINDAGTSYDDTFRIAARSTPGLSVLVLNEGAINPYIQAAFHTYEGFRVRTSGLNDTAASWKDYNLILINGITQMDASLGKKIFTELQNGHTIYLLPGRTNDLQHLNEGLKQVGDIQISGIDTAAQVVSTLQQGSSLVKDLFEKIPENVQLPQANWHYIISAGLTANQQSVMSFRNGDPFLARYTPERGQLYISATAADLQSGNFPGSYFFVPFIYQMATQSGNSDINAITAGSAQPLFFSLQQADERSVVHFYSKGLDIIPPQRPEGSGLNIYLGQTVQTPGFYHLSAGSDTTLLALNSNRAESATGFWTIPELKKEWKDGITWVDAAKNEPLKQGSEQSGFPLWKVCAILAVLMLAAETYLLAGYQKQTTAA